MKKLIFIITLAACGPISPGDTDATSATGTGGPDTGLTTDPTSGTTTTDEWEPPAGSTSFPSPTTSGGPDPTTGPAPTTGMPGPVTTGNTTDSSACVVINQAPGSLDNYCIDDPWPDCALPGALTCEEVMVVLAGCDTPVTTCDYMACVDAMNAVECKMRPPECAGVIACISAALSPGDECCAEHGAVEGKRNTCAISEEPFCLGCDGEPVLCWTVGCGTACNPSAGECAEDCCLSDAGETVACE